MKVVVLTGSRDGFASLCIPALVRDPNIELALVILNTGEPPRTWNFYKRKIKKTLKIGILGTLNGIRMRPWFSTDVFAITSNPSLEELQAEFGFRLEETPQLNGSETQRLIAEADADLGLSLGNAYIASRVFTLPKFGFLNVHHEQLPEFRGAMSVFWQIYEGRDVTGYTIHQIDKSIDTGKILGGEIFKIEFMETLRETISHNYARSFSASVDGLVKVINEYPRLAQDAGEQGPGRDYTTPSFWNYLRAKRQNRKLRMRQNSA